MSEWLKYGVRRRDKAEPGVIAAFKAAGATVLQLTGRDIPDLAVGAFGVTYLIEVKTDNAKLRPGQKRLCAEWNGSPIEVVRTPAQARKCIAVWREQEGTTLAAVLRSQEAEAVRAGAWAGPEVTP